MKLGNMIYTASGVGAPILELQANRSLVIGKSWAFVLGPVDATHTRLIVRTRHGGFFKHAAPVIGGVLYLADRLLALPAYEPGLHFFMERKMMLGIKQRAEQAWRSHPQNGSLR